MLSQIIFNGTLAKAQMMMSVTTKIAVQMNCKLGGEAWTVEIPVSRYIIYTYTFTIWCIDKEYIAILSLFNYKMNKLRCVLYVYIEL